VEVDTTRLWQRTPSLAHHPWRNLENNSLSSTENLKKIFTEKELRSYSPNSYFHVSVSDLFIPLIGLPILLQDNKSTERGNI
jgi:hypothetical protein